MVICFIHFTFFKEIIPNLSQWFGCLIVIGYKWMTINNYFVSFYMFSCLHDVHVISSKEAKNLDNKYFFNLFIWDILCLLVELIMSQTKTLKCIIRESIYTNLLRRHMFQKHSNMASRLPFRCLCNNTLNVSENIMPWDIGFTPDLVPKVLHLVETSNTSWICLFEPFFVP